jgi:hypothetical protein
MTLSGPEAANEGVKIRLSGLVDPPRKHLHATKNSDLADEERPEQPSSNMEPPRTNEKRRWSEDEVSEYIAFVLV